MSPFGSFLSNLKNYQVMFGVIISKFKCLWKDGRCTVYILSAIFDGFPFIKEKSMVEYLGMY